MVFDKNKYKFMSETERIKIKNGNIYKIHNKSRSDKNSSLYKEYVFSSPFKNIVKNKKSNYINLYQNNNKIGNNIKPSNNNHNPKKNNSIKKLKYNKSFELNMNKNIIPSNNFEFVNDNLYTINYNKHKNSKNFNNNSVILNNKSKKIKNKNNYKSVIKSGNVQDNSYIKKSSENPLIKKLDDKFLSLENNIIDQKYENDIDHDEMIINSNRKNITTSNNNKTKNINKGNNSNKLSNIIGFNNTIDMNDDLYLNINKNNNFEIDENYLLNTSFENQRSDFSIMYTYDYEKTVLDDLLSLEIKLVVEKMLEMQKSYHKELNLILNQYNKNKEIFNLLIEKITFYRKKIHILQKMEEKKNTIGNIYNFVNIYHNNNKHEVNKINKSEFNLWKNIIFGKNKNNKIYDKEKIRQIFKIIAFDRYYKISNRLNNIEEKIVLGLMKKYKYNKNNDVKSYNNSNYKTTNNKHYKSKSNKNNSTSPIQAYKMVSKRPRNDNSEKMNKMKYKKLVSISQPKQANIYNFKNIKQK